ncbi:MAG: hypothetical protein JJU05_16975 [Verrucomicrobia bacterium]|nr:hypothetical protein [Verrucomicrobiota bacterium]
MSYTVLSGEKETHRAQTFTMVVDGMALDPNRGQDEVMLPRVQLEILQLLVKIQKRERWPMWVLFNGEELRQVSHGDEFMGIRVFFSPTPPQRIPTLLECIKVLQREEEQVLLVTQDERLETKARALGAATLRGDTFKKGYEEMFMVRQRPQSRLMRSRSVEMEKSRLHQAGTDSIRDLIDLVE